MPRSISIALVCTTLAGLAGCTPSRGEDPSLLVGRVWTESQPEKPTDYIQAALLLPRPALGVFSRSSAYDFRIERFDYQREGQTLKLTFPQSGKTSPPATRSRPTTSAST
jgi:hypothetical protein